MIDDTFAGTIPSLQSPALAIEEIVPDDVAELTYVTRALNVSASGIIRMETINGSIGDVFVGAGVAFPIRARRIFATGTTASGIRGLF